MNSKLNPSNEQSRFESRFAENVIEVAAVTGALGIGASRGGGNSLWNASINLIAWKNLHNDQTVIKEGIRLEWLVSDQEWEKAKELLTANTVVKLQVRQAEGSMMLVQVLETPYKDDELESVLQEAMKPVFYHDEILGEFELDKRVKTFEKRISWAGEECYLCFDWNDINQHQRLSRRRIRNVLFRWGYVLGTLYHCRWKY